MGRTCWRLSWSTYTTWSRELEGRSDIPGYTTPRSSSTGPGYRSSRGAKQDSKPRLDGLERVQDVEVVVQFGWQESGPVGSDSAPMDVAESDVVADLTGDDASTHPEVDSDEDALPVDDVVEVGWCGCGRRMWLREDGVVEGGGSG